VNACRLPRVNARTPPLLTAGVNSGRDNRGGRDPGYTYLNCDGVEAECLISGTPVQGGRMVRPKDYPRRPAHYLSSNLYTTLAAGRETGNQFVAFDFQVEPGGGPLAHTHTNEWETFFVEDGTIRFVEGVNPAPPFNLNEADVPAGSVVYGSKGPIHGLNFGRRSRIFSFAMPAGLDASSTMPARRSSIQCADTPISTEEIVRTAFWAEQRGDALWIVGMPPPVLPPGTPEMVVSSTSDTRRPLETSPFGEARVVLLTPTEVGNTTGAMAFCGPGRPGRPGGTVKYSYFALRAQRNDFPATFTSQNTEVFYTLGGSLSFNFGGFIPKTVTVETGTFVQIDPGVPFSIANLTVAGQTNARLPSRLRLA
jgi:mannose-6-phosphate isomerase-like protein (cupin superfamily)